MRRLLRSRQACMTSMAMRAQKTHEEMTYPLPNAPKAFECTTYSVASRHEDEPEPTEDEMIKTHYLKHHPLYELRNIEEFHVDGYRHWLHGRVDYWNTETYPAKVSPWEMGSKFSHMFFVLFPFFAFTYIGAQYKIHLRENKNIKMPIVGVFS